MPSYVKGVRLLADLKGKGEHFGGRIIGIEPGAGEMKLAQGQGPARSTASTRSTRSSTSSTAGMLAELDRSYVKKEPVASPCGRRTGRTASTSLTKLKDPKGAWGTGDGIHTLARKGFAERRAARSRKWLKNFKMTEKQLTGLESEDPGRGQGQRAGRRARLAEGEPGRGRQAGAGQRWRPAKGKDAGAAPRHRLLPLGRGHRHHLPVEERPGAARLQAQPQAVSTSDRCTPG